MAQVLNSGVMSVNFQAVSTYVIKKNLPIYFTIMDFKFERTSHTILTALHVLQGKWFSWIHGLHYLPEPLKLQSG
jgi:hypothetical protein